MWQAAVSSVVANTSNDLGVVWSSSFERSQRGFATIELRMLAYWGLQERSSEWTASAWLMTCPLPMDIEEVLTASICILNHFLSSCRMNSWPFPILVKTGVIASWNFRSSTAVWLDLVDMMRLPWVLKLAATTFMCLDAWFVARAALILVTMVLGSGLVLSGMPLGRNCAISLDGW